MWGLVINFKRSTAQKMIAETFAADKQGRMTAIMESSWGIANFFVVPIVGAVANSSNWHTAFVVVELFHIPLLMALMMLVKVERRAYKTVEIGVDLTSNRVRSSSDEVVDVKVNAPLASSLTNATGSQGPLEGVISVDEDLSEKSESLPGMEQSEVEVVLENGNNGSKAGPVKDAAFDLMTEGDGSDVGQTEVSEDHSERDHSDPYRVHPWKLLIKASALLLAFFTSQLVATMFSELVGLWLVSQYEFNSAQVGTVSIVIGISMFLGEFAVAWKGDKMGRAAAAGLVVSATAFFALLAHWLADASAGAFIALGGTLSFLFEAQYCLLASLSPDVLQTPAASSDGENSTNSHLLHPAHFIVTFFAVGTLGNSVSGWVLDALWSEEPTTENLRNVSTCMTLVLLLCLLCVGIFRHLQTWEQRRKEDDLVSLSATQFTNKEGEGNNPLLNATSSSSSSASS